MKYQRSKEGESRRLAATLAYYAANPTKSDEERKRISEGTKKAMQKLVRPLKDRFWEKVDIRKKEECWMWKKPFKSNYPLCYHNGLPAPGNRLAYLLHHGSIPDGAHICHTCDNRACCNPHHLYAGNQLTNVRDAIDRNRFKFLTSKHGEDAHNSKLTEESVRTIRAEYPTSKNKKELAKSFGITRTHARRISKNEGWEHVS